MFDRPEVMMKKMACKRAYRHAKQTDPRELAHDLEQEGWLAYHFHGSSPKPVRWLYVKHSMNDYLCTWIYGTQYKQAKKNGFKVVRTVDLDVTPLKSLDPSVEDLVYGIEIMDGFERKMATAQKGNKLESTLTAVILSDSPHVARGLMPKFNLARGGGPARMERLREIYEEAR